MPHRFGLLLLVALPMALQAQPSGLVLRNANLIDGMSREPARGVTIVVANGRIAAIDENVDAPAGAREIDLHGQWVLPGLIDVHTHVGSLTAARTALSLGVTTLRTMHVNYYTDIAMGSLRRGGEKNLPEILAGGYQLRPDMVPAFFVDHPGLADMGPRVSGAANVRRLVQANAQRGVDFMKILATERGGTPDTDPRRRTWTDEELDAIVDEARKYGLGVVAHAHGDEGVEAAVRAGVREVHHGTYMTAATMALMKSRGIPLVSTRATLDFPPSAAANNPAFRNRLEEMKEQQDVMLAQAWKAGVLLAGATDGVYANPAGLTMVSEIEALARIGVPPLDAIYAATSRAAVCAGISQRTGAIRVGLEADLIVVEGDPLQDLGALRKLVLVVSDGQTIVDKTVARQE